MKLIKISIIALILTFSMQFAKAQVSVGIHIGAPVRHVYYERPYPVAYARPVYYEHPVYYRSYSRPVYYRTRYYSRPAYYRSYNRPVYYRSHYVRSNGWHGRRW